MTSKYIGLKYLLMINLLDQADVERLMSRRRGRKPVNEEANAAIKALVKLTRLQEISLQERGGKA